MLPGRTPTKHELEWLDVVAQTPCLACALFHNEPDTVGEIHHLDGKTKDGSHLRTISLCAWHHRIKDNHDPPRWTSRHGDGKKAFTRRYMSEEQFLAEQKLAFQRHKLNVVGG